MNFGNSRYNLGVPLNHTGNKSGSAATAAKPPENDSDTAAMPPRWDETRLYPDPLKFGFKPYQALHLQHGPSVIAVRVGPPPKLANVMTRDLAITSTVGHQLRPLTRFAWLML